MAVTPQVFLGTTQRATTPLCGTTSLSTRTSTQKTPTFWMGTLPTCRPSAMPSKRRSRRQAGSSCLWEVSSALCDVEARPGLVGTHACLRQLLLSVPVPVPGPRYPGRRGRRRGPQLPALLLLSSCATSVPPVLQCMCVNGEQ